MLIAILRIVTGGSITKTCFHEVTEGSQNIRLRFVCSFVSCRHFSGVICSPNLPLNPDGVGSYGCTACRKRFATAHGLEVRSGWSYTGVSLLCGVYIYSVFDQRSLISFLISFIHLFRFIVSTTEKYRFAVVSRLRKLQTTVYLGFKLAERALSYSSIFHSCIFSRPLWTSSLE